MTATTRKPNTPTQQADALVKVAADVIAEPGAELRTYKSGNTGVYLSKTIKGAAARDLGIDVPPGGKVKVQVTLIVVDPENSDS